jgi:hypothetical protein
VNTTLKLGLWAFKRVGYNKEREKEVIEYWNTKESKRYIEGK